MSFGNSETLEPKQFKGFAGFRGAFSNAGLPSSGSQSIRRF